MGVTASWVRIPPCPVTEARNRKRRVGINNFNSQPSIFNFHFLVALSGEIAVPCICNPLSRVEFSGLGPRLWGRPMHGALISGPRATTDCESRQGRKAATVSNFRRAPRESCFEPPTTVPPGNAFVKARVRDHFFNHQSRILRGFGFFVSIFRFSSAPHIDTWAPESNDSPRGHNYRI